HAVHMVWGRGRTSGTARRLRSAWLGLALVLVAALSAAAAQAAPARTATLDPLSASATSVPIGTPVTITATVNPAVSGVDVAFDFAADGHATPSGASPTTTGGHASFSFTDAPAEPVTATVTDAAGGQQTIAITFTGGGGGGSLPDDITLTPSPGNSVQTGTPV